MQFYWHMMRCVERGVIGEAKKIHCDGMKR